MSVAYIEGAKDAPVPGATKIYFWDEELGDYVHTGWLMPQVGPQQYEFRND